MSLPTYLALIHKDAGTGYGVSFPDVPGCISAGDSVEEALSNASEALGAHLALMRDDGDVIAQPRSYEELRRDPLFIEDAEGAILALVAPRTTLAAAE